VFLNFLVFYPIAAALHFALLEGAYRSALSAAGVRSWSRAPFVLARLACILMLTPLALVQAHQHGQIPEIAYAALVALALSLAPALMDRLILKGIASRANASLKPLPAWTWGWTALTAMIWLVSGVA
jgi:hypothetical protein